MNFDAHQSLWTWKVHVRKIHFLRSSSTVVSRSSSVSVPNEFTAKYVCAHSFTFIYLKAQWLEKLGQEQ
jgi:hypothetical protein